MSGQLVEEVARLVELIAPSPSGEIARGHHDLGDEAVVLFQAIEIIGQSLKEGIERSLRIVCTETPEPMVPAELQVRDMQECDGLSRCVR